MERQPLEVKGVQVHSASKHKRTVRLDVLVKDGEMVSLEMDLPIVTRLTDQLIDAEYQERRPEHVDTSEAPAIDFGR